MRVAGRAIWADADHLAACLHDIRTINFSITESRGQALERFAKVQIRAPFGPSARFPADRDFVDLTFGDWPRKIQQLMSALGQKDRAGEKELANLEGMGPSKSNSRSADDAATAFWNSTTQMIDTLARGHGVFDQELFEHNFGSWIPA